MKILIVSESFLKGGLETYLYTMYEELKSNNEMFFSVANFGSELNINKESIFINFKFSSTTNISDFVNDVENLVEIIKIKNIDLIVVNPFYSFYSAIFAAHITNTKLVYIYHGMASLNFPNNIVDTILFRYAFETTVKKVFCVTYQGVKAFKTMNYDDAILLSNPINEKLFKESKVSFNKKWVLISRLDKEKFVDIIKLLDTLPKLEIDKLDIYGEGSEFQEISDYIVKNNLQSKIELKGYSDNIYKEIANKYTGVVGLGRVAIEGLVMNYPVLLIGYNKIVGVINQNLYENIAK